MGRPDFGTVMVSRFVSQKKFKVLDLRIPSKEKWNTNMKECILFFPLIIASMVQVKNNKDTYKPEYLIPQLLIEWVISHNRDKNDPDDEILGIKYTSAHKNDDFNFPDTSYDNYAIPVLTPLKSKKYCSRLEEIFHLTTPTYYDLEVLRNGEPANYGALGLDEEQQKNIIWNIPASERWRNFFVRNHSKRLTNRLTDLQLCLSTVIGLMFSVI